MIPQHVRRGLWGRSVTLSPTMTTVTRRPRRGAALVIVLVAMTVMAIMGSSSVITSLQEVRAGRQQLLNARAQAAAEFGANSQLASWPTSRSALVIGGTETQPVVMATGDEAAVTVLRLDATTFLVTSVGRASMGNGALSAERTVSQVVRQNSVTVTAASSITMRQRLDLRGSYTISGINTRPPGWSSGECPALTPSVPALTFNTAAPPTIQKAQNVINGTLATTAAASDDTYDTLWNSFVGLTNITLSSDPNPFPVGSVTSCTGSSTNWGEPWRGGTSVAGCQSRYQVIRLTGNRQLNSGRGQGVLLVDGSLRINGSFNFVGIIMVRDNFDLSGIANIHGAVYVKGENGAQSRIIGNGEMTYSSCAVTNVTSALGGIMRVSQRPWAGLYY